VQVDAHIGTRVEPASWLRLSAFTLNTVVKNCGSFSKRQKSLNRLPLEELESALAAQFKAST
jgi:hypothetical protein